MLLMNKLALIFFVLPLCVFSQSKNTLSGKVINQNDQPIYFVEVVIQTSDSIAIKSELTDEKGNFTITDLNNGTYLLNFQYFNESIYSKPIDISGNLDLGKIIIAESISLKNVIVKGKKTLIERKVDRLVFNVENSLSSTGGNALDVLKRTPSVQVRNDNIALVGRSNVMVMINDRIIELSGENLSNYLESIASDDIKSIEVITTPPAKYQAEGNSGLINIVLKSGTLNSWNNTIRSAYIQTTYPAYSFGNTFSYNKNKLSINASLDGKKGSEAGILDYTIDFPNAKNISQTDSKNKKDYYSGRLGIDFDISDKTSIGGIISFSESTPNSSDKQYINIFDDNEVQFSQIISNGDAIETDRNISTNLHYIQHLDTLGRKLSMDLDFFNFIEDRDRFFSSSQTTYNTLGNYLAANNTGNQEIKNYSISLNMEHPTKWANLSYGGKLSFTNTDSGVEYYNLTTGMPILDPTQTDDFKYEEDVQAFYFDIAKNFGEKWQIKFGLRYENTQTESFSKSYNEAFIKSYGKLFPTAYILYLINEKNFFNLNYSRRIKRPSFWELNPFKWYLNANSYAEGNPFLQPSFNHNIELTHGYKQKLFSTFIIQITDAGFGQVPNVEATNNQQIYTRENYYKGYAIGLVENYSMKTFRWWESNNQFYLFFSKTTIKKEFENDLPVQNGWNSVILTNNSFILNNRKTFLGELNFNYSFPSSSGIYKATESYSLDLALKYLFFDKSLVATLSVNDIFKTSNPDTTTYSDNIRQVYNNYYDNRYFKLSLSYSFGNKKLNVQKRDFGNEEEQNRTN